MRFATIFVLGAAVVSTYASLFVRQSSSLPECYLTCVAQANLTACNNDSTNTKCICTNAGIVSATTACVYSACTGSNLSAALSDAQMVCEAVGVTLTPSGTSSGSSASATASTTAASSASAATASTAAAASAHGANAFISLAAVVGLVALAL